MRAKLPRLSASEAVNNFGEFGTTYSERNGISQNKYRHISHKDFHKSQEMIKTSSKKGTFIKGHNKGGEGDLGGANSEGVFTNE